MCGIIGVVGENSVEKTFDSLKRLDYRGYDSWGLALKEKNKVSVFKKTGKLPLKNPLKKNSSICIGHTRWATHGKVTVKNAHPHYSNDKKIFVVHNGIIENYEELKKALKQQGFKFYSETDSEIIPNLIQFYMSYEKTDFITAIVKTLNKLEGNYSVIVMHEDFDGLVAAKNGSPLICGVGEKEFLFASDAPAFLPYTRKAIYLNDLELAIVGNKELHFFDLKKNKKIEKKEETITWSVEQAKKGKYAHFMLKEIFEQPNSIKLTLEQPREKLAKAKKLVNEAEQVFLIGSGTSYNAALTGTYFFSEHTKKKVFAFNASEFNSLKNLINEHTLIIALSQSGETADLIDAINFSKLKKSKILSIVNVIGSTVDRKSDLTLLMNAGPEICVLSTKSFTSQLTILMLLTALVSNKEKQVKKNIIEASEWIKKNIEKINLKTKKLAKKLFKHQSILVIGRKEFYPIALESALKIKEVSYIHAEGYAGGELKHGPIALIEKNFPVIVLSSNKTRTNTLTNANEVKSRGGKIIGIDSVKNNLFDEEIIIQEFGLATSLVSIIPIQLLSYYLALEKGFNPDKPRNLAKSVTVR